MARPPPPSASFASETVPQRQRRIARRSRQVQVRVRTVRRHDVVAVEQVAQVQLQRGRAVDAVLRHGIHHHVRRQRHRIAQVGETVAHVVHAAAHAPGLAELLGDPGREGIARGEGGALAFHQLARVRGRGARDARIQERVAEGGLCAGAQFSRERQLQPARALRTDGDQHRGLRRVGGLDVGALQLEERGRGGGAAVQQFPLRAHFIVGGALGLHGRIRCRQREHLGRRLVRAAHRGVVRLHGIGLPDQAQARAPGGVRALEIGLARQAVVGRLPESVVAQARQQLPLLRERELVLHVEATRVVPVERAGGQLASAVQRHDRQHRMEQVHCGDGAVREAQRVLVLLAQFHAVQHLVLHAARAQLLDQLGLVEHAVLEAVDARARERHGAGGLVDGTPGQGVLAVQFVVVVAQGIAQAQGVGEPVLEGGGEGADPGFRRVRIACIGRAVVGARVHGHRATLVRRNAEIGHALVPQVIRLQHQRSGTIGLPQHRRRDRLALQELLAAVAVGILGRTGHPPGPVAARGRAAHVELGPLVRPTAHAQGHVGNVDPGLFRDAVHQAARGAAAVEHGGRPLHHFHAFDVGEVAEVERIIAEAVHELIADAGEPADAHLVALPVARGQAHARHVAQRVLDRGGALVADHLLGHHVDGLRHVAQRGLGLGAAGGRRRVIGRVLAARGLHTYLAQRGRATGGLARCCLGAFDGEGAPILRAHDETRAGHEAVQCLAHLQRATQRGRTQPLRQFGGEHDLRAALAGECGQRLRQRLRGQVDGQGLGMGGCGDAQRRGQGRAPEGEGSGLAQDVQGVRSAERGRHGTETPGGRQ